MAPKDEARLARLKARWAAPQSADGVRGLAGRVESGGCKRATVKTNWACAEIINRAKSFAFEARRDAESRTGEKAGAAGTAKETGRVATRGCHEREVRDTGWRVGEAERVDCESLNKTANDEWATKFFEARPKESGQKADAVALAETGLHCFN